MRVVTYISQVIKEAFRDIKVSAFGRNDTRTSFLGTSFGEDFIPPKGAKMVQISSTNSSESVIVCIVNKADESLNVGEKVIYSTDDKGAVKAQIYLRNDGRIEVIATDKVEVKGTAVEFMEGSDNAVRYSKLESEFNELKSKYNNLVTIFNAHIHTATGPTAPTTSPTTQGSPSAADITQSKIDEIKVP